VRQGAGLAQGQHVAAGSLHRRPDQGIAGRIAGVQAQADVLWRLQAVGQHGNGGQGDAGRAHQVGRVDVLDGVVRVVLAGRILDGLDDTDGRVPPRREAYVVAPAAFTVAGRLHDDLQVGHVGGGDQVHHPA